MKVRTLGVGTVIALVGWFALTPINIVKAAARSGEQLAQNEEHAKRQGQQWQGHDKDDQWYQGQRGHWYQDRKQKWQWRGAKGDEWYQGQQGHWYDLGSGWLGNGWQFQSTDLICNNQVATAVGEGISRPTVKGW